MTDLIIRPLVAGEEELFHSLADDGLMGRAALGLRYTAEEYRPEWTWVALRAGVVVARAAWWGGPEDSEPVALDWFDFSAAEAAVALLRAAPWRAEYPVFVRPDWQELPEVRAAVDARVAAARAAGMRVLVERHKYRWTPSDGLAARPGRLVFRAEPDDEVIRAVLKDILTGSLDAHSRRAVAEQGADAAARQELDLLNWLPSPREWWLLAYTRAGELVGITVPARNFRDPIVAFVGVVPGQRGHGYAYDLLVEATQVLVGHGADRIRASTDVGNVPMAAHFARAGYPIWQHQIDLVFSG